MSDYKLDEVESISEDTVESEVTLEAPVPKIKNKYKGKATGSIEIKLHWVQDNMLNFAKRYPDMAYSAKSVFEDGHLDDEHLQAVLNRELPLELNHFIRWLLKIDVKTRTEWQNK